MKRTLILILSALLFLALVPPAHASGNPAPKTMPVQQSLAADTTGPTATSWTLSQGTVNAGQAFTISVNASDPSGLRDGNVWFYRTTVSSIGSADFSVPLVVDDINPNALKAVFTVPSHIPDGSYRIDIIIYDKAGNSTVLFSDKATSWDTIRIVNPDFVFSSMEAKSFSISSNTVYQSEDIDITITVDLKYEAYFEFIEICVYCFDGSEDYFISEFLRAYKKAPGIFQTTLHTKPGNYSIGNAHAQTYGLAVCRMPLNPPPGQAKKLPNGFTIWAGSEFSVKPLFSISGIESASVLVGSTFDAAAGVKMTNALTGDVTEKMKVDLSAFNTSAPGLYTISYSIHDTMETASGQKHVYSTFFRWVGVSEVARGNPMDPLVVSNENVPVVANSSLELRIKKDGVTVYTGVLDEEGIYTVTFDSLYYRQKSTVAVAVDRSGPIVGAVSKKLSDGGYLIKVNAHDPAGVTEKKWMPGVVSLETCKAEGMGFDHEFQIASSNKFTIYACDGFGYESVYDYNPLEINEAQGVFTQYLPAPSDKPAWYFDRPQGIATDKLGNVYVADTYNNRVQKLNSNGEIIAQWGTKGAADGEFDYISGIALDSEGNVYVADSTSYSLMGSNLGGFGACRIQVFDATGKFLRKWGSFGDGEGQFMRPEGLAIDSNDRVYVSDWPSSRVLVFDTDGNFIKQWGNSGTGNGEFDGACGIAVDGSGYVYVVDLHNARVQKFDCDGNFVAKWGSPGSGNGQMSAPWGIAVDKMGYVYVTDSDEQFTRIQKFDANGRFIKKWSKVGSPRICAAQGIAADDFGNVYVGEAVSVFKFSNAGKVLARWSSLGSSSGAFHYCSDVAVDSSDNLYVCDRNNRRIVKYDKDGKLLLKWSTQRAGENKWELPERIQIGPNDHVFVVKNGPPRVYEYDSSGKFIKSWPFLNFNDYYLYSGNVAIDPFGNVYIYQHTDKKYHVYAPDGTEIKTLDLKGGYLRFGPDGTIYAVDFNNKKVLIHDEDGNLLRSFAVCKTSSAVGEYVSCIEVDYDGNVFVGVGIKCSIEKYDKYGNLIATWGKKGFGINMFNGPGGIAIDHSGNVYVADQGNSRIMKKPVVNLLLPEFRYVSLNTSPNLGFLPGGLNSLSCEAAATSASALSMTAFVFNSRGKWVAQIPLGVNENGEYACAWDGRATVGNTAGLKTGALVPRSSGGTKYAIRVNAQNEKGSTWSATQTIRFYSSAKVKFTDLSTSLLAQGQTASLTYQIARYSTTEVQILDVNKNIVAVFGSGLVFPNRNVSVAWDGTATEGNNLGLPPGTRVAPGKYSIRIIAGTTVYKASKTITVL